MCLDACGVRRGLRVTGGSDCALSLAEEWWELQVTSGERVTFDLYKLLKAEVLELSFLFRKIKTGF